MTPKKRPATACTTNNDASASVTAPSSSSSSSSLLLPLKKSKTMPTTGAAAAAVTTTTKTPTTATFPKKMDFGDDWSSDGEDDIQRATAAVVTTKTTTSPTNHTTLSSHYHHDYSNDSKQQQSTMSLSSRMKALQEDDDDNLATTTTTTSSSRTPPYWRATATNASATMQGTHRKEKKRLALSQLSTMSSSNAATAAAAAVAATANMFVDDSSDDDSEQEEAKKNATTTTTTPITTTFRTRWNNAVNDDDSDNDVFYTPRSNIATTAAVNKSSKSSLPSSSSTNKTAHQKLLLDPPSVHSSSSPAAAAIATDVAIPSTASLHHEYKDDDDETDNNVTSQTSSLLSSQHRDNHQLHIFDNNNCDIDSDSSSVSSSSSSSPDSSLRTMEDLQTTCWKCRVPFQLPNNKFCHYAMHLHPLLKVPVCSVCADDVLNVEDVSLSRTSSRTTTQTTPSSLPSYCSGCGRRDDETNDDDDDDLLLLLCDSCPRAFCKTCVICAHGGVTHDGATYVETLLLDDEQPWSCPYCSPPAPLVALQHHAAQRSRNENDDNKDEHKHDQTSSSLGEKRTLQHVVNELQKVEMERRECERILDDESEVLEQKRTEIRLELLNNNNKSKIDLPSSQDIETSVENELQKWKGMWIQHDLRLFDRVSSLQEEIDLRGGNLAGCYAAILGETNNDKDNNNDDDEPAWKKAADAELFQRQEQEDDDDNAPLPNSSDPSVYEKEIPEDVEDLGPVLYPDETANRKSQWRTSKKRARKEEVEKVLIHEDQMLDERNIPVLRVVNDTEDIEESRKEEEFASGRSKDGTSRVRRDEVILREPELRGGNRPRKRRRIACKSAPARAKQCDKEKDSNSPRFSQVISNEMISIDDNRTDCMPPPPSTCGVFDSSSVILSSPDLVKGQQMNNEQPRGVRTVSIAASLANQLKDHQIEGVEFMWKNCFYDLAFVDPSEQVRKSVGGCILAHNMGLGKSLTCVSLTHALLNHPNLAVKSSNETNSVGAGTIRMRNPRLIRTVLLIVPTNVLPHWEDEFDKWTGQLFPSVTVYNLSTVCAEARLYTLKSWANKGGVLLVSSHMFARLMKSTACREVLQHPGPDIVVADEAHTMLTKTTNEIFKALMQIQTRRRIALTGSPIQNNLFEYFRMVRWVRPDVLGSSESNFDKEYAEPIMRGLASDASAYAIRMSNDASRKLHNVLSQYVQRKDAQVLRKELPPMQQVILHVRQTKTQARLYRAFKAYRKATGLSNFFTTYQMIRPIHNHPGTLTISNESIDEVMQECTRKHDTNRESPSAKEVFSASKASVNEEVGRGRCDSQVIELLVDSDDDAGDDKRDLPILGSDATSSEDKSRKESPVAAIGSKGSNDEEAMDGSGVATEAGCAKDSKVPSSISSGLPPSRRSHHQGESIVGDEWWRKTVERHGGVESLKEVEQGYKVVLLLHILVQAQALGDKVLIFAQCLKTLDLIETVLSLDDWAEHVPALSSSHGKHGGWEKNVDYLRIDGSTQLSVRGDLIARFNDTTSSPGERKTHDGNQVKAFLLSAKACGIGINLTAANRVVLFDNHFNPTVLTQALYRSYRYGQTKPVFAYRLMTEGSIEEKIYSRSVNKTGVALRVLDNKSICRSFSARELRDLEETDTWVQCDRCEKWRMLPVNADLDQLPDKWFCEMNELDSVNNSCDASEKDSRWYYRHQSETLDILKDSPVKCIARETIDSALSKEEKAKLVERDKILTHLLNVTAGEQKSSVISKYYFHDALLSETEEIPMSEEAATIDGVEAAATADGGNSQPILTSLVQSIDEVFAIATDKDTMTVGDIIHSLESEYSMKFEKETRTFVRHRIKELVREGNVGTEQSLSKAARTSEDPSADSIRKEPQSLQAVTGKHSDAAPLKTENTPSTGKGSYSTPEKRSQSHLNIDQRNADNVLSSSPSSSSSASKARAMASISANSPAAERKPACNRNDRTDSPLTPRTTRLSPGSTDAKRRRRCAMKSSDARRAYTSARKQTSTVTTALSSSEAPSTRQSPPKSSVIDLRSDNSDVEVIEILHDSDSL